MILAILQARTSSSRLPGKVLKEIIGMPMLIRQIERIKRSKKIDKLIIATSTDEEDNQIEKIANEYGVECFRGSLDNVLDRFYQATQRYKAEHIVRLTGDCPLLDWEVIDKVIELHLTEKNDYTSNTIKPTFPDGLDVEIMKFNILKEAWEKSNKKSEQEHVTLYIHSRPEKFKLGCLINTEDLSSLRWTVDEPEDFLFIEEIYKCLYSQKSNFSTQDILNLLLKKPKLATINARFERNEGLKKSLLED